MVALCKKKVHDLINYTIFLLNDTFVLVFFFLLLCEKKKKRLDAHDTVIDVTQPGPKFIKRT